MQLMNYIAVVPAYVFYSLSLVAVIVGDYTSKLWSLKQSPALFVIACLAYLLSGAFYMPILLKNTLVVSATIWVVLNTLGFLVIGFLLFKETVSFAQGIGLVLGTIAVIILGMAK